MATIATIVAAGASAYSAYSQSQKAGSVQAGQKPQAAEYQPVDFGEEQLKTVNDDLNNLGAIRNLNFQTNDIISNQDMRRAQKFVPGYKTFLQQEANNTGSLLKGQLPYDDVLGIASQSNGLNNALGTPGTGMPGTLKDLGISRLGAMQQGQGMLSSMIGQAEQVSPVARYSRPQDYYLYPNQTVPWEIEQRQLEQQSLQNKYNLAAGVSPTQLAQNAAALSGASNPTSAIGPAIGSIAGALSSPTAFGGGSGGTAGYAPGNVSNPAGGYGSDIGAINAAPYASSFSYDPTIGYTPVPYAIAA